MYAPPLSPQLGRDTALNETLLQAGPLLYPTDGVHVRGGAWLLSPDFLPTGAT